jgi:hypothetical protein
MTIPKSNGPSHAGSPVMTPVDKKYGEDEVPPLPADDLRPEWEKENREIEDRKPSLSEIEEDTTDFD